MLYGTTRSHGRVRPCVRSRHRVCTSTGPTSTALLSGSRPIATVTRLLIVLPLAISLAPAGLSGRAPAVGILVRHPIVTVSTTWAARAAALAATRTAPRVTLSTSFSCLQILVQRPLEAPNAALLSVAQRPTKHLRIPFRLCRSTNMAAVPAAFTEVHVAQTPRLCRHPAEPLSKLANRILAVSYLSRVEPGREGLSFTSCGVPASYEGAPGAL